jgi:hypothetical protein
VTGSSCPTRVIARKVGARHVDAPGVECPTCRRPRVMVTVQVAGTAASGDDVALTMHACSACDTHWWERGGRRVDLATVLRTATDVLEPGPKHPVGAGRME